MSTYPSVKWEHSEFGTRTEMKNLNSFKAIARAIEGEKGASDRADRRRKESRSGNKKMG